MGSMASSHVAPLGRIAREGSTNRATTVTRHWLVAASWAACAWNAHARDLADAPGVRVATLPLEPGYYVASDTPCAKASNATLLLLRRNGIGGARYFCEFKRIEQTGPATYRVEEECADFQGDAPETRHLQYILDNDSRFLAKEQDVVALDARYCAQSELPLEWRNTDIESEIE